MTSKHLQKSKLFANISGEGNFVAEESTFINYMRVLKRICEIVRRESRVREVSFYPKLVLFKEVFNQIADQLISIVLVSCCKLKYRTSLLNVFSEIVFVILRTLDPEVIEPISRKAMVPVEEWVTKKNKKSQFLPNSILHEIFIAFTVLDQKYTAQAALMKADFQVAFDKGITSITENVMYFS